MNVLDSNIWDTNSPQQLSGVLVAINDRQTMQNFLRDVMTEKEIIEISSRLEAARMLSEGSKYTDIVESTKLSSRTIARISQWMQSGTGGYKKALNLIAAHHTHLPPARAE